MKPVSDFFSRVMPYLPGCPEPTAAQALVDAAIVFCEDSLVIRNQLDTFSTVVGQDAYELDVPTQQQVSRVLTVFVEDTPIPAWTAQGTPPVDDARASPTAYYVTRNNSELRLRLYPTPDKAYPIKVVAALRPTRTATRMEDDLLDLWSDAVIAGALSRLMAVTSQAFTNPGEAMRMQMMAAQLARRARTEGNVGSVRGSMRVTPRPFA